jgi:hypothetical protein
MLTNIVADCGRIDSIARWVSRIPTGLAHPQMAIREPGMSFRQLQRKRQGFARTLQNA